MELMFVGLLRVGLKVDEIEDRDRMQGTAKQISGYVAILDSY